MSELNAPDIYMATMPIVEALEQLGVATKSVLYSIAHFIDAQQFLCLDADMLVLGSLGSIFAALDACPPNTTLACREGNYEGQSTLGQALENPYIL